MSNRGGLYPLREFHDSRRLWPQWVPAQEKLPNIAALNSAFFGNDAARDELEGIACRREPACIIAKELNMRNKILAIAAIAGALGATAMAQAQTVVTTTSKASPSTSGQRSANISCANGCRTTSFRIA
jgi:hypothetical protein